MVLYNVPRGFIKDSFFTGWDGLVGSWDKSLTWGVAFIVLGQSSRTNLLGNRN